MGAVSIVGVASANARNAPPSAYLAHLQTLIQGLNLTGDTVINGAGETLVPGAQPWTPQAVADWVNSGNNWVDWCGWPMYYQASVNGALTTLGDTGWQGFARQAGYAWLDQEVFSVSSGSLVGVQPSGYKLVRGFNVIGSVAGVWLPSGSFTNLGTGNPILVGGGTYPLSAGGHFALVALHAPRSQAPGAGVYVYAAYTTLGMVAGNGILGLFGSNTYPFVPADTIATFLGAVARGETKANGMTIAHAPYSIAVPKAPTGGGSPTPYKQTNQASGITTQNGYYVLTQELSGNMIAAREGITLAALQAANPLSLVLKQSPNELLKVGTRLKAPGGSTKTNTGGSGGPSGSGSTPATPSPTATKVLEYAGIGAAAIGVGAGAIYGYRHIVQGRQGQ